MHSHSHSKKESSNSMKSRISLIIITIVVSIYILSSASKLDIQKETDLTGTEQKVYFLGTVLEVEDNIIQTEFGEKILYQDTKIEITSGEETGKEVEINSEVPFSNPENKLIHKGCTVIMTTYENYEGELQYIVTDVYRLNSLLLIFISFFALIVLFTGIQGISSLFGLVFSIIVIIGFVGPQIIVGANPFLVSIVGAVLIAIISIYLAHGVNKRTTIALVSTLITILITTILAFGTTSIAKIIGIGSEEATFLASYLGPVNFKGILLGAIVLGTLGVLDDVTTAQAAAVNELKSANPKYKLKDLYNRGMSVGKEHILSLVNTLVLAYVATSFPILLLLTINNTQPIWVLLNSEFIIEEIIRSVVGSLALVFAVPITTYIAAYIYSTKDEDLFYNKIKAKMFP